MTYFFNIPYYKYESKKWNQKEGYYGVTAFTGRERGSDSWKIC